MLNKRRLRRVILMTLLAGFAMLGVFFAGFLSGSLANAETKLATEIAQEIAAACPIADPGDKSARDSCGEKLGKSKLLTNSTAIPVLWGVQTQIGNYNLITNRTTTMFHPLVMWRVYLSLFMFPGNYKIEQVGDQTIIHMPYQYRNKLDMGEYPYPYWHSKKKWESFQFAPEVLLLMEQGKVAGLLRSAQRDRSRPYNPREWDGRWHWTGKAGEAEPRVTLFEYLFSKSNPYVAELDSAYRALDAESRKHTCTVCHNPSNPSMATPLGIMEFPNQALSIRHRIVRVMEANRMPPAAVVGNRDKQEFIPAGIADEAERQRYLKLARAFADAGDRALAYEGQPVN